MIVSLLLEKTVEIMASHETSCRRAMLAPLKVPGAEGADHTKIHAKSG